VVFSDINFILLFLPAVFFFYFSLSRNWSNYVLLFSSFLFYYIGEGVYTFILIFIVSFCYSILKLREKFEKYGNIFIGVGVSVNIFILLLLKYSDFLVENFNSLLELFSNFKVTAKDFHNPIGISFYVFQAISLLIDTHRNDKNLKTNFLNIYLYVSLFPQLVAGPIVRFKDIVSQFVERHSSQEDLIVGTRRFVVGLSKKVLVADMLAPTVEGLLNSQQELSFEQAWFCVFCFSMRVYFDFSGYSDMAIGLCRIFGFKIKENFRNPYESFTMQELWSRWHISLTKWFKDYVFVNLRMALKKLKINSFYLAILINFILIGFWHGASWSFFFFGFFHGSVIILERLSKLKRITKIYPIFGLLYTQVVWMTLIPFFIINEYRNAFDYVKIMYSFDSFSNLKIFISNELKLILSISIIYSYANSIINSKLRKILIRKNIIEKSINIFDVFLIILFILTLSRISINTFNPFIYFQF